MDFKNFFVINTKIYPFKISTISSPNTPLNGSKLNLRKPESFFSHQNNVEPKKNMPKSLSDDESFTTNLKLKQPENKHLRRCSADICRTGISSRVCVILNDEELLLVS